MTTWFYLHWQSSDRTDTQSRSWQRVRFISGWGSGWLPRFSTADSNVTDTAVIKLKHASHSGVLKTVFMDMTSIFAFACEQSPRQAAWTDPDLEVLVETQATNVVVAHWKTNIHVNTLKEHVAGLTRLCVSFVSQSRFYLARQISISGLFQLWVECRVKIKLPPKIGLNKNITVQQPQEFSLSQLSSNAF